MAESNAGKVLYAVHQGIYVLKLVGEIRVALCATLDSFIGRLFVDARLKSVVIDLSEAHMIDSTALGLIAKIAIESRKRLNQKPCIISPQPDISRILDSMGFEQVFNIVHEAPVKSPRMSEMPQVVCNHGDACDRVLEAHRILMDMNEKNRETFSEVVSALEEEQMELNKNTPPGQPVKRRLM